MINYNTSSLPSFSKSSTNLTWASKFFSHIFLIKLNTQISVLPKMLAWVPHTLRVVLFIHISLWNCGRFFSGTYLGEDLLTVAHHKPDVFQEGPYHATLPSALFVFLVSLQLHHYVSSDFLIFTRITGLKW